MSSPGVEKTFRIQFLVNNSESMHFYENFRCELFRKELNFEQSCHQYLSQNPFEFSSWSISRNLCIFMKIFARNFFVEIRILNIRATTRGRKKPFKFSFWLISCNLYIFMKRGTFYMVNKLKKLNQVFYDKVVWK